MNILTPKVKFLGGALVSASHLGKLFPGKLYTWGDKSEFLDTNEVVYQNVLEANLPNNVIWCNDTCVDEGYYPNVQEKNEELWSYLCNFKKVILVNHQPISRCASYLYMMLTALIENDVEVHLLNYRACWNTEFENYLKIHFPKVNYGTLPYHYYLTGLPRVIKTGMSTEPTFCCIGRSNSRCKVHHVLPELDKILGGVHYVEPDPARSNRELMKVLQVFDVTLTGYYYGGEGCPEFDAPFNKLEWSFIDAFLSGSMPVTSSLFKSELERLNLKVPMIDYKFNNLENIVPQIVDCYPSFIANYATLHSILWNELQLGNLLITRFMKSQLK